MEEELEKQKNKASDYNPSDKSKERIDFVYNELKDMVNKRNQRYVQFNDRTLKEFIDDSEKRLNAYVLDKASQGKEDWQANFATRAYANKAKALLAATAKQIPDIKFKAVNQDDRYNGLAADVMKNLVRHSYYQGNPQEELFFLSWSNVGHGTVISYEGFEKQVFVKKRIKSYDYMTGDVEEEIIEKASYGEPCSYEIPLTQLFIKNFYIRDIQEQPSIILETYYADKERFEANYGGYKNFKYVKDISDIKEEESDTYFKSKWQESLSSSKGYIVHRYMNKYRDIYRIIANGVELYNGPMIWVDVTRKNFGKKAYPFAKTIYEPFATGDFFYGNSLPNSAMGEGDVLNTLYNTSLDKQYRSMVPPLLIGQVNKDMLDLEDEVVAGDTKIYVDDINQVKQMEIKGINDSDIKMIDLISNGLNLTTLDPMQEGMAAKYVTARAALGADERSKQLKGVFAMFMESLWLQKMRLRTSNIMFSYTVPKIVKIVGENGKELVKEKSRLFNVENTELSDGSKGTLGIEFRDREEMKDKSAMMLDIESEEERNLMDGRQYEKMIIPFDWLDKLSFDVEIIPETLWQSSQALSMAMTIEKITLVKAHFPEYFSSNKEIFFRDLIKNYSDDVSRYNIPSTMSFEDEKALELAMGNRKKGGQGSSAGGGMVSDLTGTDTNNSPTGGV